MLNKKVSLLAKKGNVLKCLSVIMMLSAFSSAKAEDKDEGIAFEVGADVVSSYVWRGMDCGGFSAQPSATVTWSRPGISFGVWASAELFQKAQIANMNEFDLSLSYSPTDNFSVTLTDYNFCSGKYFSGWSNNINSTHNLECTLGYDFGCVALGWNTVLTGPDHREDGKRAYSSYFEASAPFSIAGFDCSATVGACPWGYNFGVDYGKNFSVINISVKAQKELKSLPLFGEIVFNPREETTYFLVGVSF